ncbi:MAG: hypothetical protein PHG03_04310 [Bacilli bacterium]|nr:hypothetical protein [Bacilli bacterium]MDD4795764.1 hypothetical protein [Bacilli bacterium]
MKYINLEGIKYKVIKTLETDNWQYYYTIDEKNDNEVVIIGENLLAEEKVFEKVDEREYPILMNKFALK